jgi:hypothetical protein
VCAHPNLVAYVEQGTTRPAFKGAMAAQHVVFAANVPAIANHRASQ